MFVLVKSTLNWKSGKWGLPESTDQGADLEQLTVAVHPQVPRILDSFKVSVHCMAVSTYLNLSHCVAWL